MPTAATVTVRTIHGQAVVVALLALLIGLLMPAQSASAADPGTITGTVTTEAGQPVKDVGITVETSQVNADGTTTWIEHQTTPTKTAADGTYTATVPAGNRYRVGFHGTGFVPEYYADAPSRETGTNVVVAEGAATNGIDASLVASRGGVAGTVRNRAFEPIANVPVKVRKLRVEANGTRTWDVVTSTTTRADGTYLVRDLAPGSYRLGFEDTAYEPRYYPGANNIEEGSDVVVQDGITRTGLDVVLFFNANIKGRIKNADGTPYTGQATVEVLRETRVTVAPGQVRTFWEVAGGDSALVDGHYDFYAPGDSYRVRVTLPDGSKGYLPALDGRTGLNQADEYVVASETTFNMPHLDLPDPAFLSGLVRNNTTGEPVGRDAANIELFYQLVDQIENGVPIRTWEKVDPGPTDANGRFSLRLIPRIYKVRINTPGLGRQFDEYYRDKAATPEGFADAETINLFQVSGVSLNDIFVGQETELTNTVAPWVEGGAKAGQTLRAHLGAFSPSGATLSVQWLEDGVPIAGEVGMTYAIPAFSSGGRYAIRVTARKAGLRPATATSIATGPAVNFLATAALENRALPVVSGDPVTGSTLTTTNGQWSETPSGFTYQWQANGVDIAGATGRTYQVAGADQGKRLTARVTATQGSRTASATSAPTAAVTPGTIVNQTPPTISGAPAVGEELVADPGTWSIPDPSFAYQWFADDVSIPGATAARFTPGASQVGQRLSVRVTASKAGHSSSSATSARTAPVVGEDALANTEPPSVVGVPRVGNLLTADEGSWRPTPDAFSYEWLADGTAIAGATEKTYTPVAADEGKRLSVRVTARLSGVEDGVATSEQTAPVESAQDITVTRGPSIDGTPAYQRTLTVDAGEYSPEDVAVAFQWYRDGAPITGADEELYRTGPDDLGHRLAVRVEYSREGSETVTRDTAATPRIRSAATMRLGKRARSRAVRLGVAVTAPGVSEARGFVKVFERGRRLKTTRLQDGIRVFTIRRMSPGRHRLTFVYGGERRITGTTERMTVFARR